MSGKFINADCMEYLPTFSDGEFDLAITDPPYGGGAVNDAADSFNGKRGRFGQRFDRYFNSPGRQGVEQRLHCSWKDGWDMGDEVPNQRGCL